ncbi:MAG: hypothetical protein BGN84_15740 [Afipia sp. 62-7]|nr:MAG: hypothetical protein BGN84_15740 [Afipia sp. 62-7]
MAGLVPAIYVLRCDCAATANSTSTFPLAGESWVTGEANVITSEAKQSVLDQKELDCFLAMRVSLSRVQQRCWRDKPETISRSSPRKRDTLFCVMSMKT